MREAESGGAGVAGERNDHHHRYPRAFMLLQEEVAAVVAQHGAPTRESEAGCLVPLIRGKERFEAAETGRRVHARATIGHDQSQRG